MHLVKNLRTKFRRKYKQRNKKGQGITEYGAVLAFICILIACAFGATQGSLRGGVSSAFSSIATQLNNMSSEVAESGS